MVKFNASVGNVEVRMLRIVQIALLIENLGDTLCTGHTHRHHNKYHGEHHEAHKDIHAIGKKLISSPVVRLLPTIILAPSQLIRRIQL